MTRLHSRVPEKLVFHSLIPTVLPRTQRAGRDLLSRKQTCHLLACACILCGHHLLQLTFASVATTVLGLPVAMAIGPLGLPYLGLCTSGWNEPSHRCFYLPHSTELSPLPSNFSSHPTVQVCPRKPEPLCPGPRARSHVSPAQGTPLGFSRLRLTKCLTRPGNMVRSFPMLPV